DEWKFDLFVKEGWETMLGLIESAVISIDCEQFILDNDTIGNRFMELFESKARQGVRVRLLCDAAGSYNLLNSSRPAALSASGVQILFFNIINPWRINNYASWFFRNHKKMLIVDGTTATTGGVSIRDSMHAWRDSLVTIRNRAVGQMTRAFDSMWDASLRKKRDAFKNFPVVEENFSFLVNAPLPRQRFLYRRIIRKLRQAKRYIYLTTPYFVPDPRGLRVLRLAARRGIDVRLLIPRASDHPFVDRASASYFHLLLDSGVRIFRYSKGMMHTKTIVVDDEWATIGSLNYDNLSFLLNYEGNLTAASPKFAGELRDHFIKDLESALEVRFEDWSRRPLREKTVELLTWPLHGFL
ncbi:MAG: phospholipase D-like domain-containing protein, partial [bacterium]|nr:phospholipase D-like domain-containing protein [bacterium]